jgi:hypothetical protein
VNVARALRRLASGSSFSGVLSHRLRSGLAVGSVRYRSTAKGKNGHVPLEMLLEIILHFDCDESDNHVLASLTQRRIPFDHHVENRAVPAITCDRHR